MKGRRDDNERIGMKLRWIRKMGVVGKNVHFEFFLFIG